MVKYSEAGKINKRGGGRGEIMLSWVEIFGNKIISGVNNNSE